MKRDTTQDQKTADAFANSWNHLLQGSIYTTAQFADWLSPIAMADVKGKRVLALGCGNASFLYHSTQRQFLEIWWTAKSNAGDIMCGICGIVNLQGDNLRGDNRVDVSTLRRMCDAMVRRGPDGDGYFTKEGVGIAMRRLAIVDIQGGQQPIPNENQDVWIVCNGEIYNYPQLRKALEHRGHIFRSNSDIEVILHSYEEYGDDFLNFINGMFAFAIWDERRRKLFLGRDRVGIKPLYYAERAGSLIFSSDLKSLIEHPLISKDIDQISLNHYLSFEYVPSPRTIFKDVYKLEPGHLLEFSANGLIIRRYWDLNFEQAESRPPLDVSVLRDQFVSILEEVVRLELQSDVPVGVFLSGGIDSSAVAAMAMRHSSGPLKTFTLKFEDASFDESRYAKMVADHIGSVHLVRNVSTKMIVETMAKAAAVVDEPFGDSSIVPTLLLSELAHEHVKVVLGGDGGDELFAGYPTLQAHRLVHLYEHLVPQPLRARVVPKIVASLPVSMSNLSFDYKAKRFLAGRGIPMVVRHHNWLGSFSEIGLTKLLHPDLRVTAIGTYDILHSHLNACDAKNPYNQLLYCDTKLYLEGDILAKVDRASMSHSLEVRVPILNLLMLRFASTLPFEFKMKGFKGKYLFKNAMKGILPTEIINRKKKGFNIPVGNLFQKEAKSLLLDSICVDTLKRQGFFDTSYVEQLVNEHMSNRSDHRKQLWTLFMFQQWYAHNIEQ